MSDAPIVPINRSRPPLLPFGVPDIPDGAVAVVPDVAEQLSFPDLVAPPLDAALTIDERFAVFHRANPHVYVHLRNDALDLVRRGRTRVSMKMLFEVLRWSALKVRPDGDYKLNNDYTSRYARLLSDTVTELTGVFAFRTLDRDR